MTLFLKARCGSIQLLIDVRQVREVLDAPPTMQASTHPTTAALLGHCSWREQILPCINMPRYFDRNTVSAGCLVVVDSGVADPALVVLAVEASDSLLELEDTAITDIADQHDKLAPVFAGVYSPLDSSACHLLLRFPATWMSSLLTGVDAA